MLCYCFCILSLYIWHLSAEEVILRLRGQQLTLPYLNGSGFTRPIFVEHKDGLDLNVPQDSFTVEDVENYIGK